MDLVELPEKILVYGSDNINIENPWTKLEEYTNVTWLEYPYPYFVELNTTSKYNNKYYKIEIMKKELVVGTVINEYWLISTVNDIENNNFIVGDDSTDYNRQQLYKITSKKWLTHTNCDFGTVYGNIWLDENEWAQVSAKNIYIKNINPITQTTDVKRIISGEGACINAVTIDSSKNMWIWGNSSPLYPNDATATKTAINNYAYLAIQPQYGDVQVEITPETMRKIFDNDEEDVYTYVDVSIKNTTLIEYVTGKVKLVIDGYNALFVDNEQKEITIEITDVNDPIHRVEIVANGPTRIDIVSYLLNQ
jgi:hypothetical protein